MKKLMDKEQRKLLIELVRVERRRLGFLRKNFYSHTKDGKSIRLEILLCNETLKSLEGGK
jgi:hypothetical protein